MLLRAKAEGSLGIFPIETFFIYSKYLKKLQFDLKNFETTCFCSSSLVCKNMKRHFHKKHMDFIKYRMSRFNILNIEKAITDTYIDFVSNQFTRTDNIIYQYTNQKICLGDINACQIKNDQDKVIEEERDKEEEIVTNNVVNAVVSDKTQIPLEKSRVKRQSKSEQPDLDEKLYLKKTKRTKIKQVKKSYLNKQEKFEDENKLLLSNFISKKVGKLTRWFCECCREYSGMQGRDQDWHCNGYNHPKFGMLKHLMLRHVSTSKVHKKCKRRQFEGKKAILTINSDRVMLKCNKNLCLTGQFLASHNLSEQFHHLNYQFLHILNENLGADAKSLVHPMGTIGHGEIDIIQAQKACFLAVQEKMREADLPSSNISRTDFCLVKLSLS